jgi:hypothetical protein
MIKTGFFAVEIATQVLLAASIGLFVSVMLAGAVLLIAA